MEIEIYTGSRWLSYQDDQIKSVSLTIPTIVGFEELPIGEMRATIKTTDDISEYSTVRFFNDELWLKCFITSSIKNNNGEVDIIAQSGLQFFADVKLPAYMANSGDPQYDTLWNMIDDINFLVSETAGLSLIGVDSSVSDRNINGYFPEQTALERLQWLCLIYNLQIRQFRLNINDPYLLLTNVPTAKYYIPPEKIYYQPRAESRQPSGGLVLTGYAYAERTPDTDEEYVKILDEDDEEITYVQTEHEYKWGGSDPKNEKIYISDVNIVPYGTDSTSIRSRIYNTWISLYDRSQCEITADIIYDSNIREGDIVTLAPTYGSDKLYSGIVQNIELTVNKTTKMRLTIPFAAEETNKHTLTIRYRYDNANLKVLTYVMPHNYEYSFSVPRVIDDYANGHIYIYRTSTSTVSGTLDANATRNVTYRLVLDYDMETKTLYVIDVDSVSESNGVVTIG